MRYQVRWRALRRCRRKLFASRTREAALHLFMPHLPRFGFALSLSLAENIWIFLIVFIPSTLLVPHGSTVFRLSTIACRYRVVPLMRNCEKLNPTVKGVQNVMQYMLTTPRSD